MCGIFGYIGKKSNAAEIVFDGLKALEYRGYDSWGVAVGGHSLISEKHTGKIGKASVLLPESTFAIGHTRWATHGGVTVANAHPHSSCDAQITLVHNGIVENYQELKKAFKNKHKIKSETDTEIIAHLIEEELEGEEFIEAVRSSFNKLKGLNAIAVLSKDGEIVVAKNGSPIVLGVGKDECFLSSDPSALLPYTKQVIFLEDGQMATLNKDGVNVFSLKTAKKIIPDVQTLQWKVADISTGKFPHFLIKEIYEQPKVIANVAESLAGPAKDLAKTIKNAHGTFLVASGTAFHACLAGTYLFSKIAGHHLNTTVASEFNYLEDFINEKSLVVALSQSGETIDVIEPLGRAERKGAKIASVVNTLGSTIYRMGDMKVLLGAGPEIAVCSTKAYIAKVSFLLLVAYSLIGEAEKARGLLKKATVEVSRLLKPETTRSVKKLAKILKGAEHIYTIGRGLSYATALESALKIKEVSYIHTEGLAGGELKHGTIALISKGTPCIVFAPDDESYEAIISNATEIKSRGGLIIVVSPKNSEAFDYWIQVRDVGDANLIPMAIPAQLLTYYLAIEKGLDPDKPRNLAKSVTVK